MPSSGNASCEMQGPHIFILINYNYDKGSQLYYYWKEKFISSLPTLFAEKIRQRIRNIHNGRIPYESLTYGELINFINNEGLTLCTDLKLKSRMKKEKQDSEKELGNFCSYYGYDTIIAHSKRKNKQSNIKGKNPST